MSEPEVFILADQALSAVVMDIKDDQWDMALPEWFQAGRTQHNPKLREIINYHAYDEAWVPDVLAGKTIAEVGDKYNGDLLGDDPKAAFTKLVDAGVSAVHALTEDDLGRAAHLSYGDYPIREYLKHISYFRGVRVHDIAKAIGSSTTMPPELVQGLWEILEPEAEQWRAMGVFGPIVKVPADAPLQDRLLGLTGRQP